MKNFHIFEEIWLTIQHIVMCLASKVINDSQIVKFVFWPIMKKWIEEVLPSLIMLHKVEAIHYSMCAASME